MATLNKAVGTTFSERAGFKAGFDLVTIAAQVAVDTCNIDAAEYLCGLQNGCATAFAALTDNDTKGGE